MDISKIKQRQELSKGGGGKTFKEGKTNIRLFWFFHTVTEADVKAGLYPKSKVGKKERELDRPVVVHFVGKGDGKKNPVMSNDRLMANYEKLAAADRESRAARDIAPNQRFLVNLVRMDEKPRKMRLEMIPKTVYNKIINKIANEDYKGLINEVEVFGAKLIGPNGRDFVVTYNPKAAPAEKYDVEVRDKELSEKLSDEFKSQVVDFFTAEGFKKSGILIEGQKSEDDEETSEEKDEEAEEEKSEETTEETVEEEQDEKPAKGKKPAPAPAKGKGKPKDEEEETDDGNDD